MIVKIDSLSSDGKGICYVDNNIIEIEGALPNDVVEIIITKKLKNKYCAKIHRTIKPSKYREDKCKLAGICGGCDFINSVYNMQVEFKQNKINELFNEYKEKVFPIATNNHLNYRNKSIYVLHINKNNAVIAGYYKKNSHDVVNIKNCFLDNKAISELFESIKDIINELNISVYNEIVHHGILRYLYARINKDGDIMLGIIATNSSFKHKKKFVDEIIKRNKKVKTIIFNYNNQVGNKILGIDNEIVYGEGYIIDILMNKKIKISLSSFYQVNSEMTEKLYDIIIKESNLDKNDVVLDAYCGTGTIGLLVANYVKKVVGVEINSKAIEDAEYNKMINNQANISFVSEDASKFIFEASNKKDKYSLVIMDPPRSGCSKIFIDSILSLEPCKLTYVSCNPLTLKRDLELLKVKYNIKKIIPVDMFPQTFHVETIVLLCLKDVKK